MRPFFDDCWLSSCWGLRPGHPQKDWFVARRSTNPLLNETKSKMFKIRLGGFHIKIPKGKNTRLVFPRIHFFRDMLGISFTIKCFIVSRIPSISREKLICNVSPSTIIHVYQILQNVDPIAPISTIFRIHLVKKFLFSFTIICSYNICFHEIHFKINFDIVLYLELYNIFKCYNG